MNDNACEVGGCQYVTLKSVYLTADKGRIEKNEFKYFYIKKWGIRYVFFKLSFLVFFSSAFCIYSLHQYDNNNINKYCLDEK